MLAIAALSLLVAASSAASPAGAPAAGPAAASQYMKPLGPQACANPSFGPPAGFGARALRWSVAVGDFNRDGNEDLVTTDLGNRRVSVLLGNGSGAFAPPTAVPATYAVGWHPESIAVADFNKDGNPDVVTGSDRRQIVSVLLGRGDGSFGPSNDVESGFGDARSLTVADFNRDGNPDIASASSDGNLVGVVFGDGAGGFGPATEYEVDRRPLDIKSADFNRDGFLDLVVARGQSANLAMLRGDGAGGFTQASIFVNATTHFVGVGDFNGDGNPDLVTQGSSSVYVHPGTGAGDFLALREYRLGAHPWSLVVADFNGDGKMDLAAATSGDDVEPAVEVLLGTGTGSFGAPTSFAMGPFPSELTLGDFNRDGRPDLVAVESWSLSPAAEAWVMLNTCSSSTPATATSTSPSVPTATLTRPPLPTPTRSTSCAIYFADIAPDNPFYEPLYCLACRGIVSGYSDATFRPNNPVTRGQAAKIIVGAAGYDEAIPNERQSFADVPRGNAFWEFIERARLHNLIGGYDCGAPGEPCDAQSRPYFRWNNNLTRGQAAKIITTAAGYNEAIPDDRRSFADVPRENAFWEFVERARLHNLISGYDCGASGEPCNAQGQPYFRWGSNITRGQTSKIVAGAFFPNCGFAAKR